MLSSAELTPGIDVALVKVAIEIAQKLLAAHHKKVSEDIKAAEANLFVSPALPANACSWQIVNGRWGEDLR